MLGLRTLESEHDVKVSLRISWLQQVLDAVDDLKKRRLLLACKKRLQNQSKRAKYEVFFDPKALIQLCFFQKAWHFWMGLLFPSASQL